MHSQMSAKNFPYFSINICLKIDGGATVSGVTKSGN